MGSTIVLVNYIRLKFELAWPKILTDQPKFFHSQNDHFGIELSDHSGIIYIFGSSLMDE